MGGAWGTALVPGSEGAPAVELAPGTNRKRPLRPTRPDHDDHWRNRVPLRRIERHDPSNRLRNHGPRDANGMEHSHRGYALYGVDENAAGSHARIHVWRHLWRLCSRIPRGLLWDIPVPPAKEFNNWLLGWHDPVSAFLASGNPMDMTVGWTSLESNATYYGFRWHCCLNRNYVHHLYG